MVAKCPLKNFEECILEDCMWYDVEECDCAITALAFNLNDISTVIEQGFNKLKS